MSLFWCWLGRHDYVHVSKRIRPMTTEERECASKYSNSYFMDETEYFRRDWCARCGHKEQKVKCAS